MFFFRKTYVLWSIQISPAFHSIILAWKKYHFTSLNYCVSPILQLLKSSDLLQGGFEIV
jgi:hypothetical protein